MGCLLISIEKITGVVNRCTVYQTLYRPETTSKQVLHNLNAALVKLYATTLRLLALIFRLFTKTTTTRALHSLINPGEISDFLSKFQDVEPEVDVEAQNCERMRSRDADAKTQQLLEDLRKPIIRSDERVTSCLVKLDEKELLEILDWMSDVLYGKTHDTVREQRTKDTCEWLLKRDAYLEWQGTSSSTILWLHGTGRNSIATHARTPVLMHACSGNWENIHYLESH